MLSFIIFSLVWHLGWDVDILFSEIRHIEKDKLFPIAEPVQVVLEELGCRIMITRVPEKW